jgi:transposase InsO family protein
VPTKKSILVDSVDRAGDHGIRSRHIMSVLLAVLLTLRSCARSRAVLQLELLALRHQLQVLQWTRPRRVRLEKANRWLWMWLSRVWTDWRPALVIMKPETVLAWHRRGFRKFWTWKSRRRRGRPTVPLRVLIRTMSQTNPRWGAPRIHGELLKLGIDVCQAPVAKYTIRRRRPPSQTWRTFLTNHVGQLMAADFFVVPTATGRLLFVLVILAHARRRVVHVAVTEHPTAAWTGQQLREAFPWDQAPWCIIRDRDHAFAGWANTAKTMGIEEVLMAPRSPWQNAYVERFIGSVQRECLDHVIVLSASGLQRLMHVYSAYYERSRTHLSVTKDAPIPRPIAMPGDGRVVAIPQVGGLHHRYERQGSLTPDCLTPNRPDQITARRHPWGRLIIRPVRDVADPLSATVDMTTMTVAISPKGNSLVLFNRNRKRPSEPPPRFSVFDEIEFLVGTIDGSAEKRTIIRGCNLIGCHSHQMIKIRDDSSQRITIRAIGYRCRTSCPSSNGNMLREPGTIGAALLTRTLP